MATKRKPQTVPFYQLRKPVQLKYAYTELTNEDEAQLIEATLGSRSGIKFPFFTMEINGFPAVFLWDSGSDTNILTESAVRNLGGINSLPHGTSRDIYLLSDKPQITPVVLIDITINDCNFGIVTLVDVPFAVFPDSTLTPNCFGRGLQLFFDSRVSENEFLELTLNKKMLDKLEKV